MKRLAITLVIGLAVLTFLLLRGKRPSPSGAPEASPPVAEAAPWSELARLPVADAQPSGVEREPEKIWPAEPAPAPEVPDPEPRERIEGVLRVLDELDVSHEDLDGSFLLTPEDESEGRTIEVRGGHFTAEVRIGVPQRAEDIRAGGRLAVPLEYRQPLRNAAGEWEVTARWARATVLTVVAADTGAELAGIDLVENAGGEGCQPSDLDGADWLARDARSPITLPLPAEGGAWPGTRTLHARAPGYAWGCVSVPDTLGGEFRLALERGGSLEIRVVGQDASVAEASLRLRRAGREDDDPTLDEPLGGRTTITLDALEVGAWVATLELGHRWRWPRILAQGEVEVTAGGHAVLELRVEPVEEPRLVTVAGRVRASRAWGFRDLDVNAELLDEPPRGSALRVLRTTVDAPRTQDEEPAVWEWKLEDVQPGRWSLGLPKLGLGCALDVPLQGLTDVELVVPDPVEASVELRERGTDLLVPDARLHWMPPRPWTDVGGMLFDAEVAGAGRFTFRAPAGPVDLWCMSNRHRFAREELELSPPRVEHVVRLDPACGFVLRVRHETMVLPWPFTFGYGIEARRTDGEGRAQLTEQDANELETRFTATAPGRYRLELPIIPGYAPIPPQEIVVPSEGFVRHDVELRVP